MILLMDGFDMYAATDFALRGWDGAFAAMVTGRFGFGKACTTAVARVRSLPANSGSSVFMQTGYMSNGSSGTTVILTAYDGATIQFELVFVHGSDVFELYRGDFGSGTLLATSPMYSVGTSLWQFIELNVQIAASGGSVTLKVNSATIMTQIGLNTSNSGNAWINRVGFGGGSVADAWDDFVIFDSTGATPNTFLGDRRIATSFPIADGAHADFIPSGGTNHWSNVDEPTPNMSDGVASATVGAIDTYKFTQLTDVTNVDAVQVNVCAYKSTSGVRTMAPIVRQGTADYSGPTKPVPASESFVSTIFALNPATSAPWTMSDLNADEIGLKVVA